MAKRFYGLFKVLAKVGKMAYHIELPLGFRIHNVFHVFVLQPFKVAIVSPTLPVGTLETEGGKEVLPKFIATGALRESRV